VCGLQFSSKAKLKVHQNDDGGRHRVYVCAAKSIASGTACGEEFFSKESHDAHKAAHKAAQRELKIKRKDKGAGTGAPVIKAII
jgi:hypothetical protein